MRYNLKYRDLILRPYPPALLGAYIIIMPATLFCWTNVPKMKLIDGTVMSGSDWLSVIATISYPTVRVVGSVERTHHLNDLNYL